MAVITIWVNRRCRLVWRIDAYYAKIQGLAPNFECRVKEPAMVEKTEKKLSDINTFVENINKKNTDHNGKKIHFAFCNRKRKG
jgi:hypothetical protein